MITYHFHVSGDYIQINSRILNVLEKVTFSKIVCMYAHLVLQATFNLNPTFTSVRRWAKS